MKTRSIMFLAVMGLQLCLPIGGWKLALNKQQDKTP